MNLNYAGDLGTGYTEIALPSSELPKGCSNITPEVGITGTPVIDVSVTPPVIYVVTKHEDVSSTGVETYRQKLHGLYADTLQEIPGSPLVLDSTFAVTYTNKAFDPWSNNQRAGLALVSDTAGSAKIWVSWGSHCDKVPYHGAAVEFTYNYGNNAFQNAFSVFDSEAGCKSGCRAGIWMGGAAPAVDASGNVYLATGNGADTAQGTSEFTNSVIRLNDSGMQDFYSPPDYHGLNKGNTLVACSNPNAKKCVAPCAFGKPPNQYYCQVNLASDDWDLGTAGVVLLAPTFALNNPEVLATGKQGMIYLLFAGNLGQMDSQTSNSSEYACTTNTAPTGGAIVQCFMGFVLHNTLKNPNTGARGAPAFLAGQSGSTAENYLYVAGIGDVVKAYNFTNTNGLGTFNTWPSTALTPHRFTYPGGVLSVTWQSTGGNISDAIVWAQDSSGYGTPVKAATAATLFAYKAIPKKNGAGTLGSVLWDTTAYDTTVPGNPGAVKFMAPTIADGKIFIAGGAQGYQPTSQNCPAPSTSVQPTACGGIAMYK